MGRVYLAEAGAEDRMEMRLALWQVTGDRAHLAIDVLRQVYPTIPLEHDSIVDYANKERFARTWLEAHAFRKSRILDGLVPVAKKQ